MLIRRRKGAPRTTKSRHNEEISQSYSGAGYRHSEQLWVADITYICVGCDFNYLSLITDAHSKKIIGYHLHPKLSAERSLIALDMALKSRTRFLPDLTLLQVHRKQALIIYCLMNSSGR